jgi:hypothetical protein
MEIGRRGLLGLGAAVAISAATSACRDAGAGGGRPSSASSMPTTAATAAPAQFPGAPPPGQLYYGSSLPRKQSLIDWEAQLGNRLSVHRTYFTPDHNETGQLIKTCREDQSFGRLSHVSIKPTWSWRSIASGRHDDWLDNTLRQLGEEGVPVFLTIHNEPENDAGPPGMTPVDYVGMQTNAIKLAAEVAPLVTIVPVLQHWTFDPLRDGDDDPSDWIIPDASVIGLDIYNPWSPTNGKNWRSFGSKAGEVMSWFDHVRVAIGEYGCRVDPQNPGLAAEWLRDAAEFGREHQFVSMSYFNSHVNSPDGTWALQGETEETFAELLASDWVCRPA